ncbi:MAG: hypothetical protein OXC44_03505 [Proteobacteria bacterium]|nr:hypothetical protein [Pseudomonadota bacterium]
MKNPEGSYNLFVERKETPLFGESNTTNSSEVFRPKDFLKSNEDIDYLTLSEQKIKKSIKTYCDQGIQHSSVSFPSDGNPHIVVRCNTEP